MLLMLHIIEGVHVSGSVFNGPIGLGYWDGGDHESQEGDGWKLGSLKLVIMEKGSK